METTGIDPKWGPRLDLEKFEFQLKDDPGSEAWMNWFWYDGPLTGLCVYDGKLCYYGVTDIIPDELRAAMGLHERGMEYAVYEVTQEYFDDSKKRHFEWKAKYDAWVAANPGMQYGAAGTPEEADTLKNIEYTGQTEERIRTTCTLIGWIPC